MARIGSIDDARVRTTTRCSHAGQSARSDLFLTQTHMRKRALMDAATGTAPARLLRAGASVRATAHGASTPAACRDTHSCAPGGPANVWRWSCRPHYWRRGDDQKDAAAPTTDQETAAPFRL